jgi:8-oxo-dGTP diphosphatase
MSQTTPPVVRAAGAVLWRERDGRLEVTLVHRPRYGDWSWPKGKVDRECEPAAAVREVAEETGLQVVLGVPLAPVGYRTPDGVGKLVTYWAARVATDDDDALRVRPAAAPAPPEEIDDVVWVGAATAAELLTRREDRPALDAVLALWQRGRLDTRVLAIARHAHARRRSSWPGGEATRPLTGQGERQAEALVPLLAAFGISAVATSPWERCRGTVTPYAQAARLAVLEVAALTEAAYREDPGAAVAAVTSFLTEPRDAVVVTHRPVLPAVLATLGEATRSWTVGRLPRKDPYLRTGEVLVAHVNREGRSARVVAVERHRPLRGR